MSRHATMASPTVLTSQRRANHTLDAKVRLVIFPQADKLINNGLLLRNTVHLGNEAGIKHHAAIVEPCAQAEEDSKTQIQKYMSILGVWDLG